MRNSSRPPTPITFHPSPCHPATLPPSIPVELFGVPRLIEGARSIMGTGATLAEIAQHGHVLTPGRYVGAEEQADDAEPFAEKYPRLVAELEEHFAEGERLTALIRQRLGEVEHVE